MSVIISTHFLVYLLYLFILTSFYFFSMFAFFTLLYISFRISLSFVFLFTCSISKEDIPKSKV